jgi:hypothetical protein
MAQDGQQSDLPDKKTVMQVSHVSSNTFHRRLTRIQHKENSIYGPT